MSDTPNHARVMLLMMKSIKKTHTDAPIDYYSKMTDVAGIMVRFICVLNKVDLLDTVDMWWFRKMLFTDVLPRIKK